MNRHAVTVTALCGACFALLIAVDGARAATGDVIAAGAQAGFAVGAKVAYETTFTNGVRYGTIETLSREKAGFLKQDGNAEAISFSRITSIVSTGRRVAITPSWSYVKRDALLYDIALTDGTSLSAQLDDIGGWAIRDTAGYLSRPPGYALVSIRVVASFPAGAVPPPAEPEQQAAPPAPPAVSTAAPPAVVPIIVNAASTGDVPREPQPSAKAPQAGESEPEDFDKYHYRVLLKSALRVYMDEMGAGYIYNTRTGKWTPIPRIEGTIQPGYTAASDTMVLFYGLNAACVYMAGSGKFESLPANKDPQLAERNGYKFFGFSRSADRHYASQCNNRLAMAAGATWSAVYDLHEGKWFYLTGAADDSTDRMEYDILKIEDNLVLMDTAAFIHVLNDRTCVCEAGRRSFRAATPAEIRRIRPLYDRRKDLKK